MSKTANPLNWFELYVTDLDRAARFYESTLGISLRRENFGRPVAVFQYQAPSTGGALVLHDKLKPGAGGSIVYLNANGALDACIERASRAGGQVVTPKTDIGEFGAFALVRDTEGNVVGLHSER